MNNNLVNFPDAKPFVDENDRTMVPVRFISEGMGAKVTWFNSIGLVLIQMKDKEVKFLVGEDKAYVDGLETQLDTKSVMKDDRTYVPLRFVSEAMGATVGWDGDKSLVTISYNGSVMDNPDAHPSNYSGDLWGRKTRTTNLPKNAADFPYILEDLPNEMYEMPYRTMKDDPLTVPKVLFETENELNKKNIDLWADRIRKHFELVLNANYNTIDSNWVDQLYATIQPGGRYKPNLQKYADWVKTNHIQIEGTLEPEPSIIYHTWYGYTMRTKLKLRLVGFDQDKNVIFDGMYQEGEFKKGVWYSGYADISLGTMTMGNWGPSLAVNNDVSLWDNSSIQEEK
nr:copper amine oxidase N-terminal domain-containing protein [Tumebacillus amylolyticus]